MKLALAIGAVISALAAAVLLRAPSEIPDTPPLSSEAPDKTAAPSPPETSKTDAPTANVPVEATAPSEAAAASPTAPGEMHSAVPANEPRSDAIVPPVKRAKPKDPVLAGDPPETKKTPKKPAKSEPAKGETKP